MSLVSLLALTAWNVTYSTAIEDASKAYSTGDLEHALQFALDHLDAQALEQGSSLDRRELPEPARLFRASRALLPPGRCPLAQ